MVMYYIIIIMAIWNICLSFVTLLIYDQLQSLICLTFCPSAFLFICYLNNWQRIIPIQILDYFQISMILHENLDILKHTLNNKNKKHYFSYFCHMFSNTVLSCRHLIFKHVSLEMCCKNPFLMDLEVCNYSYS